MFRKNVKPDMMRASICKELSKGATEKETLRVCHISVFQSTKYGQLLTVKLLRKMVKLSTDVQLPPKLPPSASDRKDQGSIKIGEICFGIGK